MKKYLAQVMMSYYVYVEVEAETQDAAKAQALREAWRAQANGEGLWGNVVDIQEGEAK